MELHTRTLRLQYGQLVRAIEQARTSGMFSRALCRLKSLLSLVSVILSLAGIDGASEVLDTVVDLSEPLNTLAETYQITVAEQLTAYVEDPEGSGPLQVRPALVPVLERAGIDPSELAHLLREVILLERSETKPSDGQHEKGMVSAKTQTRQPKRGSLAEPESDLEQFPYHYAVKHSKGDLQAFLNIIEFIEEEPTASTRDTQAVIVLPHNPAEYKVNVMAAVLASYLGYIAITKYFLDQEDYPTSLATEKKFVTIQ